MPKRWLFVTYTPDPKRPILDPSARYRCFHRVEDLRALGRPAAVTSQQRFEREPPLDFDVYVFHRPWYSQDFLGLLDYLRDRGKRLIADLDDPVFAAPPRTALAPPFPELPAPAGPAEPRFLRALQAFDRVSAATQPLAEAIAGVHPSARVAVFASRPGSSWLAVAECALPALREDADGVAFCPGFDMPPDADLLRNVIPELSRRFPSLRIVPTAALDGLPAFRPAPPVHKLKATGLLSLARECRTIAFPCATGTTDRMLPAARALEAAVLGCRVVVPPLPDFLEHRDAGFEFAESPADWIEALIVPPRASRQSIASAARAHVDRAARSEIQTRRLLEWGEA